MDSDLLCSCHKYVIQGMSTSLGMLSFHHAYEHQESGPTMVWEYIQHLYADTASLQIYPAVDTGATVSRSNYLVLTRLRPVLVRLSCMTD